MIDEKDRILVVVAFIFLPNNFIINESNALLNENLKKLKANLLEKIN